MILPKIISVVVQKGEPFIAGSSAANLLVRVEELQIEKAYLYAAPDIEKNETKPQLVIDKQNRVICTRNWEDRYVSLFTGEQMNSFIKGVLEYYE